MNIAYRTWCILGVLGCCGWGGCVEATVLPPDLAERRKGVPVMETWNARYLYTELGQPKARLQAGHLYELVDANTRETTTHLKKNVLVEWLNEVGGIETRLTAREAVYRTPQQTASAWGQVVVVNKKGEKLETEHLNWSKALDKLSTGGAVRITTGNEVLIGDSLVSDGKFNSYRIYKLRGILRLNS